ncbi:dermonecrotic toxin domain-containing protein [Pseudomonas cichorii]|uniref:Dermonecrotic toxin N-terminal domain-containing protein n=1 Tax=Pseudomonas cichorii TaxID=36746 RepID=A0ABQ1DKT8_PSECI|nr:DUF6543 domain-containing protein [Pseudomonas cichorii]AHF66728.1 hypothetical protein PCH70_15750 [Pseudomonas cichorii JBC1]QVE18629.1 hypothetical protein KGD89_07855 [Pseudomonas cichorii]GFM91627.1 hypothetical protein PSCICP_15990 [Pseudomonas cichorii]SDO05739.1 hypothetical protein SAMN05216599_105160 [Pseudomonas cichorii]
MPPSTAPYFYSDSLKSRFTQSLTEAVSDSRITSGECQWLKRLVEISNNILETSPYPRVDRLIMEDGAPIHAELASALLISDPTRTDAPVFLSTLLFGVERFESRRALLNLLNERYAHSASQPLRLDAELIEGPVFECQMELILQQQMEHLNTLSDCLHQLPSLQTVLAQALQENLSEQLPESSINVFRDMSQTLSDSVPATQGSAAPTVLYAQYLSSTVLDEYDAQSGSSKPVQRFLGADGQVLSADQALPYVQSITRSVQELPASYERSLVDYWGQELEGGLTMTAFAGYALAESFRQKLLSSREAGVLTSFEFRRLRALLPSPSATPGSDWVHVYRIAASVEGQGPVKILGVLLIQFTTGSLTGFYMFSMMEGFRRFADEQAVATHFGTEAGRLELLRYSSLNDHGLLSASGRVQIQLSLIEHSLFSEHARSVIALQKRNLDYVLGLPSVSHRLATVQIDDALDIRGLLDSRLYGLHDSGRWRSGVFLPEHSLNLEQIPKSLFTEKKLESDFLASWGEQLHEMDDLVRLLGQLYAGVASCMRHALNRYLAVIGHQVLDARRLWGHIPGKGARSLVSLAFEGGFREGSGIWSESWRLSDSSDPTLASSMNLLPPRLAGKIVSLVQRDFVRRYELQLKGFYNKPVRLLDTRIYPDRLSELVREQTLRLELQIERRRSTIDAEALDMLQQVLDRPQRGLRAVFGSQRVEAFALALKLDGIAHHIPLTNTFVLFDSTRDAQYLMWSLHMGFKVLEPGQDIESLVSSWLVRLDHRSYVLDLLNESDKPVVRQYCEANELPTVSLELTRIEEHFIRFLEDAENGRKRQGILHQYERARTWKLKPELFCNALDLAEHDDSKRRIVGRLGIRLQMMQGDALLSRWIKEASIDDQIMLLGIWQRFYATHDLKKDFLFAIPDIHEYAQRKLSERLEADFPDHDLTPEQLSVTLTHYIPAPVAPGEIPPSLPVATTRVSESLTNFAIDRFFSAQDGVMSISLKEGVQPVSSLTVGYIRQMVRSLDIAANYRLMVAQKLDEKSADYAVRENNYIDQVPSYELLKAFQLKLMGLMTLEGYDAIESVMTMPDGIARVPFKERDITISPLQLLRADAGWAPDDVMGIYVIAPSTPQKGPWVLYSVLGREFSIKEYADRNALLADIRTSSNLQDFILSRLDPAARHVYAHGGFQEPHLPFSVESSMDVPWKRPAPVDIRTTPYKGNALQLLFKGTLETFKQLIQDDSVTNTENDQAASNYLWGLLGEQILSFMPGRLGALVGVWQSRTLFQASARAVADKHWGEAASEFTAALSMAISSRKKSREEFAEQLEEPEEVLAPDDTSSRFRWGNNVLSSQVQGRLRQLEVRDVALNELYKDNLLNTYRDKRTQKEYVAIQGKVYQVQLSENNWRIVGKDQPGPGIRLNIKQQWELDLAGLKGGGPVVSRFQNRMVNLDVDRYMVIEARGMSEIRQVFRDRTELIADAHNQARKYLENALDNLNGPSAENLHPRCMQILSEFFSYSHPDARLIDSVRDSLTTLYGALMDPSLSPHDSDRYVVGINRPAHHDSTAFVFVYDPMKRIFLTDKFFRLPYYRLKVSAIRTGEFNMGSHHRGTILLHELSHLCLNTEDIAYVDSNAPFFDLMEDTAEFRKRLKDEVVAAQYGTLSYHTDRSKLFAQLTDGAFKDLKHREGGAKAAVLRITGKNNLSQARDVFYADAHVRSEVMLNNADSLALLVSLLGRVSFSHVS